MVAIEEKKRLKVHLSMRCPTTNASYIVLRKRMESISGDWFMNLKSSQT